MQGNLAPCVYTETYKGQIGGQGDIMEDDLDYSKEIYEQDKPSRMNKKQETYQAPVLDDKTRKTSN